jgi:hypothetical protein
MARAFVPENTRRAIDRLAGRAHAFHRFAHHPLCGRYASELIPLGRKARLCRGCTFAALGALFGSLGASALRPGFSAIAVSATVGAGLLLTSLVNRWPKWLGRGLAAAAVSFAGLAGLISAEIWARAVALALLAGAAFIFWGYRRRGPHRGPCEQCPERSASAVCSGLRPIVRRERAFRRVAQRYIDQAALGR